MLDKVARTAKLDPELKKRRVAFKRKVACHEACQPWRPQFLGWLSRTWAIREDTIVAAIPIVVSCRYFARVMSRTQLNPRIARDQPRVVIASSATCSISSMLTFSSSARRT